MREGRVDVAEKENGKATVRPSHMASQVTDALHKPKEKRQTTCSGILYVRGLIQTGEKKLIASRTLPRA